MMSNDRLDGIGTYISDLLGRWQVPGLGILVVRGSERIFAQGFGFRDVENQLPVDEDTLFYIASTTKAFTAFSGGLLVDDGLLAWDQPIKGYIPEFETSDSYITYNATIVDLLSHRTGLPDGEHMLENPGYTRRDLFEKLKELEPAHPFRTTFLYNNLLYAVAGYIVGYLAGKSWEHVVTDRILTPLGMVHSDFSWLHRSGKAEQSVIYGDSEPFPVPPGKETQTIDIGGPAGSINASIDELYPWLVLHLNQGRWNDTQVIAQETLARICAPQMICGWPRRQRELSHACYGLGWVIEQYKGHDLLWHDGSFGTLVSFMPQDNIGIAILTNKASPIPWMIAYTIYDRLLDLEPTRWHERWKGKET